MRAGYAVSAPPARTATGAAGAAGAGGLERARGAARASRCPSAMPETTGTPAPVSARPSARRDLEAVGRRAARADDRDRLALRQRVGRAGDVEHRGRVGEVAQPLGVAGLAAADRDQARRGDAAAGEGGVERLVARRGGAGRARAGPRRAARARARSSPASPATRRRSSRRPPRSGPCGAGTRRRRRRSGARAVTRAGAVRPLAAHRARSGSARRRCGARARR